MLNNRIYTLKTMTKIHKMAFNEKKILGVIRYPCVNRRKMTNK